MSVTDEVARVFYGDALGGLQISKLVTIFIGPIEPVGHMEEISRHARTPTPPKPTELLVCGVVVALAAVGELVCLYRPERLLRHT